MRIGVGIGDPNAEAGAIKAVTGMSDSHGRLMIPIDSLLEAINGSDGESQTLIIEASSVPKSEEEKDIAFADERMELSPQKRTLMVDGQAIDDLSIMEFGVISFLAHNLDRVKQRPIIYESVWKKPFMRGDRTVDVYVRKLRRRIGEISGDLGDHEYGAIRSRFGIGYLAVSSI